MSHIRKGPRLDAERSGRASISCEQSLDKFKLRKLCNNNIFDKYCAVLMRGGLSNKNNDGGKYGTRR